jgi:ribonucleoside-diphosphate reductase alpha chain
MNGSKVRTKQDFLNFCKAEAIIGTLQASYTDFPFLSNITKQLTDEEALLGCSIIGVLNNPDILLNPENLQQGAKICVDINRKWSEKIGINQASRVTAIKPDGTCAITIADEKDIPSSGISAHHSKRYFRRVQINKLDPVYKFFKKHNPHMCEESVWSSTKTDDVITFPILIENEKTITKEDLTALKHLEIIKLVQQNWVIPGTTEVNEKDITHNVSCTVDVKDDEWEDVIKYLYDNKEYFSAVSLLSVIGDKLYPQAPLERIITDEDEQKWNDIIKNYKILDYTELKEIEDNTSLMMESACSGGKCEL